MWNYIIIFCGALSLPLSNAIDIMGFMGDEPLTIERAVKETIEYFKADDPHGIPILTVPEPLEMAGPYEGTMTLSNISISGHSQIRLDYVDVNLSLLEIQFKVSIPRLEMLADYMWPTYWSASEGDMNVTFIDLQVGVTCQLGVNDDGLIQITDLKPILEKDQFLPDLTGLTTQHYVLVSVADTFFDTFVLPIVQERVKDKGMTILNERLKNRIDKKVPIDISVVDFAIAYGKGIAAKKLDAGFDPLPIKDQEIKLPLPVSLVIKNTFLEGLSSLHRTKSIRAEFVDNKLYVTIELGTQNLKASTDWSLYSSLFPLASGHAEVLIDSFEISLEAEQDADIRHPPIMRWIDLKLGNIALRSPQERNVDYALEALVNFLPNILRNVILDRKVEGTIKKIAQEKFNTINWERIVRDKLLKSQN